MLQDALHWRKLAAGGEMKVQHQLFSPDLSRQQSPFLTSMSRIRRDMPVHPAIAYYLYSQLRPSGYLPDNVKLFWLLALCKIRSPNRILVRASFMISVPSLLNFRTSKNFLGSTLLLFHSNLLEHHLALFPRSSLYVKIGAHPHPLEFETDPSV